MGSLGTFHASLVDSDHLSADAYNKQLGQRDDLQVSVASSTAHIVEQRLNAGDEHLILASQGVWDVVSPDDAALRLHFQLKVILLINDVMNYMEKNRT